MRIEHIKVTLAHDAVGKPYVKITGDVEVVIWTEKLTLLDLREDTEKV